MFYLITVLILFVCLIVYFKVAKKYNIIDKPNERSSHKSITIRGGGVIFPIAFLLFIIYQNFTGVSLTKPENYLVFGVGLLLICTISFADDMLDLSSKIRLLFHFVAVTLLLWFIGAFQELPIYMIPILFIFIIGILNAYNFMDGINGITGLYSLVTLCSLWYVNHIVVNFTDEDFILFPILACFVFLFFNFRKKAKCFMGDIGSIGIAFWILALLGLLIIKTQEIKYILFLTLYGTEVVLTILERLRLRENIFKAHRRHLYQLLVNDFGLSHLAVSFIYATIQIAINIILLSYNFDFITSVLVIIVPVGLIYIVIKYKIKKMNSQI